MSTPSGVIWDCDPHTKAKHEILKRYLQRWFPILNTYHGRVVYLDGFCGPGRYLGGEPGSPLVALEVAAQHRRALTGDIVFWFIDERGDRIEHLKKELNSVPRPAHFTIHPETGIFHEKLAKALDELEKKGAAPAPHFAFIDPFGFSGIPYSLVERLLKKPRCEVFITFMVDSINRWLDHPNDALVKHMPETFGTIECLDISRQSLDRITALRELYQRQLRKAARYVRYFEMRDKNDRVIYYLFFASNNPLGHVKMKEAMFEVGGEGLYSFSDATDPNQQFLFGTDHTLALWPLLHQKFGGSEVRTETVRGYVENDTAFLETHMKATLRAHEGEAVPPGQRVQVRPTKADGKPRKKGTFPDGVFVGFPGTT